MASDTASGLAIDAHPGLAEAARLLATPPPDVTEGAAAALARSAYGLAVRTVTPLTGERDRNFLVAAEDGRRVVLKYANASEPADARDLQIRLLDHLAATDPSLPVPRVVRTLSGAGTFAAPAPRDGDHHGFVISHLDAVESAAEAGPRAGLVALGGFVARLGRALAGFDHPAADRVLLWDCMRCDRLAPLAGLVADGAQRRAVEALLAHFANGLGRQVAALRPQVIHNDLGFSNVLTAPGDRTGIAGIIDFGDAVRAPLICEIAIAASYRMDGDPDASFERLAAFLAGFGRVTPLLEAEIVALFDLILVRLVLRILIPVWRAELFPGNRAYILRSSAQASALFGRLSAMGPDAGRDAVRRAWAASQTEIRR